MSINSNNEQIFDTIKASLLQQEVEDFCKRQKEVMLYLENNSMKALYTKYAKILLDAFDVPKSGIIMRNEKQYERLIKAIEHSSHTIIKTQTNIYENINTLPYEIDTLTKKDRDKLQACDIPEITSNTIGIRGSQAVKALCVLQDVAYEHIQPSDTDLLIHTDCEISRDKLAAIYSSDTN